MMEGNSNPKLRGVQANRPIKLGTAGPPKTLVAIEPAAFYAVGYHDESGAFMQAIVLKVGDKFFFSPNAIEWASSLKGMASWLKTQVDREIARVGVAKGEELPAADHVDVVGSGDGDPSAA